jgi:hypothetical protein
VHFESISTSSKWYRDCRLELDRFLDVLFEKDYSRLIIAGDVPEDVLKEAWAGIYLQHCELTASGSYNALFEKTKQIQEMNAKIALLDGIVQYLQMSYDPELVKMVNEMGIGLELAPTDDAAKKLKIVQGMVKRMIVDMQILKKEVDALEEEGKTNTGLDHYEDWLTVMSKTYQYAVRAKDISVMQFVRNQKKINEQAIKSQRKQQHAH